MRQQAVPAAICFVYVRACLGFVLCYGRPSLVWDVLKLLQFTSLWYPRLSNTGDGRYYSTPNRSKENFQFLPNVSSLPLKIRLVFKVSFLAISSKFNNWKRLYEKKHFYSMFGLLNSYKLSYFEQHYNSCHSFDEIWQAQSKVL